MGDVRSPGSTRRSIPAVAQRVADHRPAFQASESTDATAFSLTAVEWSHTYEPLQAGRFRGVLNGAVLQNMQLAYERVDGAFRYSGRAPRGSRVFLLNLPRTGELRYDGRPAINGQILTNRWDQFGHITCKEGSEALIVVFDEAWLQTYTDQVGCHTSLRDLRGPSICSKHGRVVQKFEQTVAEWLRVLATNESALSDPHAWSELRQAVLDVTVDAITDPEKDVRLPPPSTRGYIVSKAIEIIDARLADPLSITEICASIRVAERTLRYSFEQVLGITPVEYIRALRLNRVRQDLLGGRPVTIQSAAIRWGFWHMGRFARYYRQTFGENPTSTLRSNMRSRAGRDRH